MIWKIEELEKNIKDNADESKEKIETLEGTVQELKDEFTDLKNEFNKLLVDYKELVEHYNGHGHSTSSLDDENEGFDVDRTLGEL